MAEVDYPRLIPRFGHHGKQEGIDWDALRGSYAAQLERQAVAGVDDPQTRAYVAERDNEPLPTPKKKGADPFANGGRFGGSEPKYDRKAIVDMYKVKKMTVDAIAAELGCHRQTVRNNLTAAKVTLRDDRKKS